LKADSGVCSEHVRAGDGVSDRDISGVDGGGGSWWHVDIGCSCCVGFVGRNALPLETEGSCE
jgi:hypothetical protein